MPRGFLVKRSKRAPSLSYRVRSIDDDCLLDLSAVERETYSQPFNSPDSGYGHSPCPQSMTPTKEEETTEGKDCFETSSSTGNCLPSSSSPVHGDSYPSSPGLPLQTRIPLSAPALSRPCKRPSEDEMDREDSRRPVAGSKPKKPKAARRITFDDDNRSPVHGTIIKQLSDDENEEDSLSKNAGLGGDFMCKLCKEQYPDPFSLAQHKCSRIVHVEYRCPECDKVFNCPANLASHRRWHKPRPTTRPQRALDEELEERASRDRLEEGTVTPESGDRHLKQHCITKLIGHDSSHEMEVKKEETFHPCEQCNKKFRRPANLRKHLQQHNEEEAYPCHYCGKVFGSLINRTKHMFTHAISGHQPSFESSFVKCRICGLAFGDGVALSQHERRHHHAIDTDPKIGSHLYPCKYCSTIFSDSMSLSSHIDKRHPTEHRRSLLLNVPVRI